MHYHSLIITGLAYDEVDNYYQSKGQSCKKKYCHFSSLGDLDLAEKTCELQQILK